MVRLGLVGCGCGSACASSGDSSATTPARRRVRVWGPLVVRAAGVRRLVAVRVRLVVVGAPVVAATARVGAGGSFPLLLRVTRVDACTAGGATGGGAVGGGAIGAAAVAGGATTTALTAALAAAARLRVTRRVGSSATGGSLGPASFTTGSLRRLFLGLTGDGSLKRRPGVDAQHFARR